jgi:hypothetical protein
MWQHIGNWLNIVFGLILLVHLSLIWMKGAVQIYENNKVVLGIETALGLRSWRDVNDWNRK